MIALFAWADCTRGTSVGASAAVHADIWVNAVDFALADSTCWAFGLACAASNTIVADNVSHSNFV